MTKTNLVVIQGRQAAIQIVAKMGAKAVGNLLKRIIMLSILQILSVNPPIVFLGGIYIYSHASFYMQS